MAVTRGSTQFNMSAGIAHVNSLWNAQVGLWSTSPNTNGNSSGCGVSVQERYMFWLSEEDELFPMVVYEHGYAAQALAGIQTMQGFNPWKGTYRNQTLYGALMPVLQTAGNTSCQLVATGTIATTGLPYTVNNNPETSLVTVNTSNPTGQNGALAYQCVDNFIRGGSSWQTWIDTAEAQWNGVGFGSSPYQSRVTSAWGCAILICNYDPKGIFPALDLAASKLQGSAGSFPNSYTSLTPGNGDGESCNKFYLWDCPQWLAWMQSLKGTATSSTPYVSTYVPPSYITGTGPPPPLPTSLKLSVRVV